MMKTLSLARLGAGVFLAAVVCVSNACGQEAAGTPTWEAGPKWRPSIRPAAQIPLMPKPPKIDGSLDEGEWPTLHVARFVGGSDDWLAERAGEFWLGSDGNSLYVAVRSAVHPTLGPKAQSPRRKDGEDADAIDADDSIEIWVSPAYGSDGKRCQIMLTPAGAVFDSMHRHDADRALYRTRPRVDHESRHPQDDIEMLNTAIDFNWTAGLTQAHRVQDGVWVAEVAIDFKSLAIEDAQSSLAVRVCRNFQNPKEQCRWAPNTGMFSLPKTMPRVFFDSLSPIVSETGFQDANGIRMGVDLTNPGSGALPVVVRLACQVDQDKPAAIEEQSFTLSPGQTRRVELVRPLTEAQMARGVAAGEIWVRPAKGGTYYRRDVRWRLHPSAAVWTDGTKQPATLPATVYTDWPFDANEAARRQDETAKAIGQAKETTLDLGGGVSMKLALIPAGKFTMGSPEAEKQAARKEAVAAGASEKDAADAFKNEVPRKVTIRKPFYMGITHVTVDQFAAFVKDSGYKTRHENPRFTQEAGRSLGFEIKDGQIAGRNPDAPPTSWRNPSFEQKGDHPVVQVGLYDAQAFCDWLSKRSGKTVTLPTEEQWEYACRAGTTTAYPWGDNPDDGKGWANGPDQSLKKMIPNQKDLAFFRWDDGFAFTSPVASFKANAFGLYDMIGNAFQWCQEVYGEFDVFRGGSWGGYRFPWYCRSAFRGRDDGIRRPYSRDGEQQGVYGKQWAQGRYFTGFRVVVLPAGVD